MPSLGKLIDGVFDDTHRAATFKRKIIRSLQLGPKYYCWNLPRYFAFRRSLGLAAWDWGALLNPFREFANRVYYPQELPPGYEAALLRLQEANIRLTIPPKRLMGLLGLWWACRSIPGDVIECGSYQGATGLMLALLGRENGLKQQVLLLDTFSGMPPPGVYDGARSAGEFQPRADQVSILRQQAAGLGLSDRVKIHCGLFRDTFVELAGRKPCFSFAHIDANMYSSTLEACEFVLPRVSANGAVVFDDYNAVCDLGARLAIEQYFQNRSERPMPLATCSAFVSVPS